MTSVSEIIDFIERRRRLSPSVRLGVPGEFPPGWQAWFESISSRVGAINGATAEAIVAVLAPRPLSLPAAAVGDLSRWRAFATLWRQSWEPADPEDRRWRWLAAGLTAVWHLFVSIMLVWLMYLQFLELAAPSKSGEQWVEIQYLGEGTNDGQGADTSAVEQSVADTPHAIPEKATLNRPKLTPVQPALAAPATLASKAALPTIEAALPELPERDIPEPQIPPPPAEQAVVVTKPVDQQAPDFVLPPTRRAPELEARLPELKLPEVRTPVVEVTEPAQPRRLELPNRPIDTPTLATRPPVWREREISTPIDVPELKVLKADIVIVKALPVRLPTVRQTRIPDPVVNQPVPPSTPVAVPSSKPANAEPAAAPVTARTEPMSAATEDAAISAAPSKTNALKPASNVASSAPATASRIPADSPGVGSGSAAVPGAAASPRRNDDWGNAPQQRPGAPAGGKSKLYNSDGSVRIADAPGSASPGAPPGTVSDEITDLDRSGTWLKRKPVGYEPSRLDKFWMPSETLLEEWVRKGVKQMSIRIPGTNKRVVCVVSLLQLGGGCGISDPNLNEQPATARPPPDIPFKPHLQEDNGSLRPLPATE